MASKLNSVSTLVLNTDMTPHAIVEGSRGVALTLSDPPRVGVLYAYDDVSCRSQHLSIKVPSVAYLLRYQSMEALKTKAPSPSTKNVVRRYSGVCAYHGMSGVCSRKATTRDHVVPRAAGGLDTWDNLVASCESCNRYKGSKPLSTLGWKLKFAPSMPSAWEMAAILFTCGPGDDPRWAEFLPERT